MRNKKLTRPSESPSFDGRVTLLAGPTFFHVLNALARPIVSTCQGETIRALLALESQLLTRAKGQFFRHKNAH